MSEAESKSGNWISIRSAVMHHYAFSDSTFYKWIREGKLSARIYHPGISLPKGYSPTSANKAYRLSKGTVMLNMRELEQVVGKRR